MLADLSQPSQSIVQSQPQSINIIQRVIEEKNRQKEEAEQAIIEDPVQVDEARNSRASPVDQ